MSGAMAQPTYNGWERRVPTKLQGPSSSTTARRGRFPLSQRAPRKIQTDRKIIFLAQRVYTWCLPKRWVNTGTNMGIGSTQALGLHRHKEKKKRERECERAGEEKRESDRVGERDTDLGTTWYPLLVHRYIFQ